MFAVKIAATRTRRDASPKTVWKICQASQNLRAVKRALPAKSFWFAARPAAMAWSCAQFPCGKAKPFDQISFENST